MSGIPRFPVYLFDLDGTLLDSAADIGGAIRTVLENWRPRLEVSDDYLRSYIGLHLIDLFQDLNFPAEAMQPMVEEYRKVYPARGHAGTRIYPGVVEALAALGGSRKSTATTKGSPSTRAILEQFGLLKFFDHAQGTDGFPAKPRPDVIFAGLAALGADPSECLLVGDSPADMEAGRAAGVATCAVRYGYGKIENIARWNPDYWVDDLRELTTG
ncbi:MAG: HAD-IA family hydrolase [Bryobacteraceae bacterium]